MATIGRSNIEITADDRQANRTFTNFFKTVEASGRRFKKRMSDYTPFEELERGVQRFGKTIGKPIRDLPNHLKPFHQALDKTRKELRDTSEYGSVSLNEMSDSAIKTQVELNKLFSVSGSGKKAIKSIHDLNEATKETQLAVLGLNKEGKIKISPEESTKRLLRFRSELKDTERQLEALRDAGDFASYEEGMRVVERKLADVDKAMRAAAKGGRSYDQMLHELGVNTSSQANRMAIAMEAYKDRFIRSVEEMQARSTQSKKMMDFLPETSNIQRVDRFFLGIGDRLENIAKQGTAASLALKILGPNRSMKDLADMTRVINTGLMRMQQVSLVTSIAVGLITAALFKMAKGPDVQDVLKQQADAWDKYAQAVDDRTKEILNTWGFFEKASIEKTKGTTLIKNLQSQVTALQDWQKNLDTLVRRGVNSAFVQNLRELGPEAAGQVAALANMTRLELDKYVALWKERSRLAREAAVTELEYLKRQTQKTVRELQNSLTPLGISLEKFKNAAGKAAQPFIELWGQIASKVLDVATSISNLINRLNEMNPSISAAAGMFAYLALSMSLILSPMAIGIGRANGMRAAFTYVFNIIRPFATGMLRIAGVVGIASGAIVIIGGSLMKMWSSSEKLRTAVGNLWIQLKNGVSQALYPLQDSLKDLKESFMTFLNTLIGQDAKDAKSFWKGLGDLLAKGLNYLALYVIPPLIDAFAGLVKILSTAATWLSKVLDWVNQWEGSIPIIYGISAAFATWVIIKKVTGYIETLQIVMLIAGGHISKFAKAIWLLLTPAGRIAAATKIWTAAQAALNLVLLANPIGLVIAVLVGLGVAFFVAYNKSEKFRNGVNKVLGGLRTFFTNIDKWYKDFSAKTSAFWGNFFTKIDSFHKKASSGASTFWSNLGSKIDGFHSKESKNSSAFWSGLWSKIDGFHKKGSSGASKFWSSLGNKIDSFHSKASSKASTTWGRIGTTFDNFHSTQSRKSGSFWSNLGTIILKAAGRITSGVTKGWTTLKTKTSSLFSSLWTTVTGKIGDIASEAGKIPGKIGSAISKKISSATKSMTSLASALVKRFKEALHINSPSGVFYDMAGHIIAGLTNGLSAGNLKELGTKVFKDFAGGAFSSLDAIKSWLKGGFNVSGKVSGNVSSWLKQAMALTNTPMSWLGGLQTIAQHESGGNPLARNNWDINAKRGTPSMGLMQTILPTFNAYKLPGLGNILNPVANAVAAIRYIKKRYKSIFNVPGIKSMMRGGPYKGYAKGGFFLDGAQMGIFGEGGPEMALPLIGKNMLPYSLAVAQNLKSLLGGEIGGSTVHNHYWNVQADQINEVSKMITMINGVTQSVNKGAR
ncbi:transglycosylase SLT domain-containing protein [Fictibacillus sp. NRS-1165]|uniref:transglycosylase SLT domain-containing protein n=1 Tax=Fictibacillus sp. NRS-1165 TaxID=3144463 RepID=UPI003D1E9096